VLFVLHNKTHLELERWIIKSSLVENHQACDWCIVKTFDALLVSIMCLAMVQFKAPRYRYVLSVLYSDISELLQIESTYTSIVIT
jgi:hypothetical protein